MNVSKNLITDTFKLISLFSVSLLQGKEGASSIND